MKKTLLAIALLIGLAAGAQNNVYFKIDHFLGAKPFAFNVAATNNYGNDFSVTRLEYYIAEIVLIHDGGMQTPVANKWILANAGSTVNEILGSFNITTLEGVKFAVGVEQSVNHLDPSSYAMTHPLSPKSPSMHWGWTAGYRFVALEGSSGPGLNQNLQIHALGNGNYFTHTILTSGISSGSDITISLHADYEMALKNIDISNGFILHGEIAEARDLLVNFNYDVFTSAEGNKAMSTDETSLIPNISVYPNPSKGNLVISAEGASENTSYMITNIIGKTIEKGAISDSGKTSISIKNSGIYFVSILKNGVSIATEKIIITQ